MDYSYLKKQINRNILFSKLDCKYEPILDVLKFKSGDYLPKSKMIDGSYVVYGGGGFTNSKHNEYNVNFKTIGIGRVGARCGCIFNISKNSWVTDNALYISEKKYDYLDEFLVEYLSFLDFNQYANTAAQPVISLKRISGCLIPILSIEDQKSILRNLNDFHNPLNESIDVSKQLTNEITHQLDLIKNLRQAFLREAMQGILVSNETSDGKTGADLLAEIQAEKAQLVKEKKIKKPKPLAPITEEEIPFTIHEGVEFIRLEEIATVEKGKIGIQKAIKGEFPLVVTGEDRLSCNEFHFEGASVIVPLVSSTGHGHASMKRIHYQEGKYAVGNILGVIQTFLPDYFNTRFLFNYLDTYKEPFFVEKMKGAANVSLKLSSILETPIPIINIESQNKYEELMRYCDALEEHVKQSQKTNELLLQQVLREALGDKKEKKETNVLKIIPKQCNNVEKTILAGYIINQSNTPDFGKVKFQKILHLTEYHCQIDMNSNYSKKVAGPHDTTLINNLVNNLQRYNFYKIDDKNKKHDFIEMSSSNELVEKFNDMFDDQKKSVNQIIELFSNKSWEFCELISTLYTVWNNRIINKEDITNEHLSQDFLKWNESKIKFIDKIDYGIKWIKDHNLEPLGWGNIIE